MTNWHKIRDILLAILQEDMDWNGVVIVDSLNNVMPNLLLKADEVDSFIIDSMTAKDLFKIDSFFNRNWEREIIAYKMTLKFKSNSEYILYFSIDAISSLFKKVEEKEKQSLLNERSAEI